MQKRPAVATDFQHAVHGASSRGQTDALDDLWLASKWLPFALPNGSLIGAPRRMSRTPSSRTPCSGYILGMSCRSCFGSFRVQEGVGRRTAGRDLDLVTGPFEG
eukprot:scaffold47_cov334-Pavlova_lutheri.AAC.18